VTVAQTSESMQAQVTIKNKLGLHARPAMSFVDTANNFHSQVTVKKGDQAVDGKSIMQMMMLAATQGTKLTLEASGPDAAEALAALTALVERKFDEE
jgi:phosphocarrier protein HPr